VFFGVGMAHSLDIVIVDSYHRLFTRYPVLCSYLNAFCQGLFIFPNEGILLEIHRVNSDRTVVSRSMLRGATFELFQEQVKATHKVFH